VCVANEKLPHPNHGEGVQCAVFVELIVDFSFAFWCGVRVDGFLVGLDGHVSILNSIKIAVVEVWADGGEDGLDTPTAVLAGVIVVVSGNGE